LEELHRPPTRIRDPRIEEQWIADHIGRDPALGQGVERWAVQIRSDLERFRLGSSSEVMVGVLGKIGQHVGRTE
jgi:hypothetical protein